MRLIDADRLLDNFEQEITIDVSGEMSDPESCKQYVIDAISKILDQFHTMIEDQPTVYPLFAGRSNGKTVLKDFVGMCDVLENFGLSTTNPADTVQMVCENYQKILMELTGGFMSKLNYTPEAVLAYITDRFNEDEEDSADSEDSD